MTRLGSYAPVVKGVNHNDQLSPAAICCANNTRAPTNLVGRRVRIVPISWRLLPLLERCDVHDGQLGTLLQRFTPVAHPRDTECTSGVVDSDERIPLSHHKWARRVYAKSHLLARRVERVTVAERDHAQRVARSWRWRKKVPVGYLRAEIREFILRCELGFSFARSDLL